LDPRKQGLQSQIHKLDKVGKSGKLWGPIGPLENYFLMSNSTGSPPACEYTVSRSRKKEKKGKNGFRKFQKSTRTGENRPKSEKYGP
jgi:hypothetical protein